MGISNGVLMAIGAAVVLVVGYYMFFSSSPPKVQRPQQKPVGKSKFPTTTKPTLVMYWSTGCGNCTQMKGEWDSAAKLLTENGTIDVMDIEASRDIEEIRIAQASLTNFNGVPHIVFFPQGFDYSKRSVEYNGTRKDDDLMAFAYKNME